MNMGDLFSRFLHPSVPPPPVPAQTLPSDAEIRWAQRQKEQMVRRAEELGIEVDLEAAGR